MDYTRCVVSTINGDIRVMTGEMRQLLKKWYSKKISTIERFQ